MTKRNNKKTNQQAVNTVGEDMPAENKPVGDHVEAISEDEVKVDSREIMNNVLDQAKGKFIAGAIIGVDEYGKVDILPSIPRYDFLNHILDKAQFNLLLHEQEAINRETSETNDNTTAI